MVRHSFPVGLFHSLLHAGLSRRSDPPHNFSEEAYFGAKRTVAVASVYCRVNG